MLALPFLLAACGEKNDTVGCSSEVSTTNLVNLLKKTALEEVSMQTSRYEDVTNQMKRAALEEFTFNVSSVVTKSNDPNSTMKTCSAIVSMTVPANTYQNLHDYYRTEFNTNLDKKMDNLSLEQNANTFSAQIDYTVQPTDDNKTVFVTTTRNGITSGAALISSLSIIKPINEQKKLQQQQQQRQYQTEQAQQTQLEQQNQRQPIAEQPPVQQATGMTLTQAKNAFLSADSDLNNQWHNLSSERRKALLLSQRQWIKNKDLICGKVTSQGTDAELTKIYACHADAVINRIPELH